MFVIANAFSKLRQNRRRGGFTKSFSTYVETVLAAREKSKKTAEEIRKGKKLFGSFEKSQNYRNGWFFFYRRFYIFWLFL